MPAERRRRFLLRLLPVLILAAGVTFFHWRGLQPGYTFLPVDLAKTILPWGDGAPRVLQNWLISDPLYQFYPFLTQAVASVRGGQWLLWDPGVMLGHPAAADPLFQTFYPGVLPFGLLFGAGRGYGIALYVHALLAALLMYGFLRALQISAAAAVAGAFTYALSGYFVTWFEFSFWLTTLAWLPGVLWAYVLAVRWGGHARGRGTRSGEGRNRVSRRNSVSWPLLPDLVPLRYVALGGLCLGLALLAGQLQFVVIFAGFFLAGALAYAVLARRGATRSWWPLIAAAVIVGLGGLIGAVQVVMTADFLPLSTRTAGYGGSGLPLAQLTALLLPNFFGNPSRSDYWGAGNFNESTIYVGIVAVFLAALAFGGFRRLPLSARIAGAAAVVLLYLMIGGPGSGLLQFLPVISQAPLSRFAFLLPLLVGWLAAVMVDDSGLSTRQVLVTALVLVAAAGVMAAIFWNPGIAGNVHLLREDVVVALLLVGTAVAALIVRIRVPRHHTAASWTLAALVFANLAWFGRTYNPTGKVEDLFPVDTTVQSLQAQAGGQRVVALQRGPVLFGPNVLAKFGLAEPGGYSSLVTARYHDLLTAADAELDSKLAGRASNHLLFSYPPPRLLDMLGVGTMVASEEIFDPGPDAEFARTDCTAATAPITAASPLEGTFDVWRTAINRIDLPFAAPQGNASAGDLVLRVWRGATGGDLFVETRLPVADVLNSPQQVVYFAAQPDAPGQTFRWRLESEDADDAGLRLCTDATGTPSLSVYGTQFVETGSEDGIRTYRRFTAFPRASVVYAAETIQDDAGAVTRVLDPAFDLRNTAVSSEPIGGLPAMPPRAAQAAQIVEDSNQRVVVQALAEAPALLVLADQWYTGWEATIDGAPAPLVRVNAVLRGVPLTPGQHEIIFEFRPPALLAGGVLSILGLALAAALFIGSLRRYFTTAFGAIAMNPETSYHMSPEEFRKHGYAVIDWIVDYQKRVESLPVLSTVQPGEIRAALPAHPPQQGETFEAMLADVDRVIMPGITHWQSPNFFAFFPSNNSGPSILGELLSAGLGVQGMLWLTSPACTELETHVMDWLVEMMGLPAGFLSSSDGGGVIQDSASDAAVCALLAARERATSYAVNQRGGTGRITAYCTAHTHSSIEKAMMITGLGRENLRLVEVDAAFAMRPEALAAAIAADRAAGLTPAFVCANVGSTSSNAIDPVRALGEICRREGVWFHVDGAMAGTATVCPEFRWIIDGLELADSYCFNPHKWMFTNFDCDAFFVADRKALINTLSILPEYLRNQATNTGAVIDYRDWQVSLGRRFRALKLWFVLRHYGIEGLQFHIRKHVALAQEFADWVNAAPDFELAAPAPLNLVCLRHKGSDDVNQEILSRLNASGELYLTHTKLDGRYTLRMSIGQSQTERRHVEQAWEKMRAAAAELAKAPA